MSGPCMVTTESRSGGVLGPLVNAGEKQGVVGGVTGAYVGGRAVGRIGTSAEKSESGGK